MSTPYKIAISVDIDGNDAKRGAGEVKQEVAGMAAAVKTANASLAENAASTRSAAAASKEAADAASRHATALKAAANVNDPMAPLAKSTALASHEVTNLSYQLTDIGVQLAGGQSPFLIMMQQGSQVSQILGNRGLGSLLPALASGIGSLINPTTLAMGALTAAGYAGYYAFTSIVPEVETVSEVIERHAGLVGRLKDRYGEAAAGAKGYAATSAAVLAAEVASARSDYEKAIKSASGDILGDLLSRPASEFGPSTPLYGEMAKSINDLRESLKAGTPDLRAFRDAWARMEVSPYATEAQRELAKEIREMSSAGAEADQKLRELPKTLGEIGSAARRYSGDVDAFQRALEQLGGIAAPDLSPREQALKAYQSARLNAGDIEASRRALLAYEETVRRIENNEAGALVPKPTPKPSVLSFEPPKAERDEVRRTDRLEKRTDQLAQAKRDELGQVQLEITLVGRAAQERDLAIAAYRTEAELRRSGVALHSKEAEGIRETSAALAKERVELAQTQAIYTAMRSQQDEVGRIRLERSLIGSSESTRAAALAAYQSEIELRRANIPLHGQEASAILRTARAIAEAKVELDQAEKAWNTFSSAGQRAVDNVLGSLTKGDFKGALSGLTSDIQPFLSSPKET